MRPLYICLAVGLVAADGSAFQTIEPARYPCLRTGIPGASSINHIMLADLNSDGFDDLVVAGREHVCTLIGDGRGRFSVAETHTIGGDRVAGIAVLDWNGDARADVAVSLSVSGDALVLLSSEGGGFVEGDRWNLFSAREIVAADLNADGFDDLIVGDWTLDGVYVVGNPLGDPIPQRAYVISDKTLAVEVADLNNDGQLDVAAGGDDSYLGFAFQGAVGGLLPADEVHVSVASDLDSADLNNDGAPDLVLANFGGVSVLDGPLWDAPSKTRYIDAAGAEMSTLLPADHNGDGHRHHRRLTLEHQLLRPLR